MRSEPGELTRRFESFSTLFRCRVAGGLARRFFVASATNGEQAHRLHGVFNPSLVIATPIHAFKKLPIANAVPPADMPAWKFEGNTSKTAIQVVFPNTTAAAATVWLTAFWFNPRKQSGPACAPVSTNVQGGSVSLAA